MRRHRRPRRSPLGPVPLALIPLAAWSSLLATAKAAGPPDYLAAQPPNHLAAEPLDRLVANNFGPLAAEPLVQGAVEPPAQKAAEPPVQKVAEPLAQKAAEPPAQKTAEPLAQGVAEPPGQLTAVPLGSGAPVPASDPGLAAPSGLPSPGLPVKGLPADGLPSLGAADSSNPATAVPVEIGLSANQQSYDAQLGRVVALGHAAATLAGGQLRAERIEYDLNSRTVYASGGVRFQRGQQYLQASRLRYSLLEGVGEIEDVYGVLDLDTSAQDFDIDQPPSQPLGPGEPMACTPPIPHLPDWQPYPWAATAWGGKMTNAPLSETFIFRGEPRPEALMGLGLQRRVLDGGPLSIELEGNLIGHRASPQQGGPFNKPLANAGVPAQSFGEITAGIGVRLWLRPWLSLMGVEGVSLNTDLSYYEQTFRRKSAQLLNYLAFEVEALVDPQWSLVGRIHHRSGAWGTYSGVKEGSNGYLLGLRYRFGQRQLPNRAITAMAPALGCPGIRAESLQPRRSLNQLLDEVATGKASAPGSLALASSPGTASSSGKASAPSQASAAPGQAATPVPAAEPAGSGNAWQRAQRQELERQRVVQTIPQRVSDVAFQRSLKAERRFGFPSQLTTPDAVNQFGQTRPQQLQSLTTVGNTELVKGSISRWRLQAKRMTFTPGSLRADRAAFTNDPFTPAQAWLNSEDVVATLQANGDTVIKARRNRLILDERLPIPVTRQTRIRKKEEVDNRVVLGQDGKDRDGFFIGYKAPQIRLGNGSGSLELQPQFLLQRAIAGKTDSYPLPGQSAGAPGSEQNTSPGDLFGLVARLQAPLLGFQADANLDISSFNPKNIANATRSWGDLSRSLRLPLLGESTLRTFGAYRFRVWNGSLGEQDVYSAYGVSLEGTGNLRPWGSLTGNYFWRTGVGNYQGNNFDSTNIAQLWRANLIASINGSLPLWTGKALAATPDQAYLNSAVPVVPGLTLNANLTTQLAYFGDGSNQNTISLTGGPTWTLGHFQKPWLDFTQFTITGGGTLRQGVSPLSFDRAVDLATINLALTQQIVGPLLLSGGIGVNVDGNSGFYGEITNSYVELRWQRRAYDIGIYYSPYEQLGGIRVRLNDFNFQGTGTPFVPYNPNPSPIRLPF